MFKIISAYMYTLSFQIRDISYSVSKMDCDIIKKVIEVSRNSKVNDLITNKRLQLFGFQVNYFNITSAIHSLQSQPWIIEKPKRTICTNLHVQYIKSEIKYKIRTCGEKLQNKNSNISNELIPTFIFFIWYRHILT